MQMQHASQQSKEGTLELTLELGIWNLWNYLKEVQSWNLELEPWTYDFTASSWGVTGDSRWHCDMIKVTPCDIFIHYFRKNYGEEQFQLAYGLRLICDFVLLVIRYDSSTDTLFLLLQTERFYLRVKRTIQFVEESTLWTIARWRLLLRESLEMTAHREILVEKKVQNSACYDQNWEWWTKK